MNDIKGYRWKKDPAEAGLRAVGAGRTGSKLQNGKDYIASVNARGGGWRGSLKGWYFVVSGNGLAYVNTCNETLYPTDNDAKIAAVQCIKAQIKAKNTPRAAP